MPIDPSAPTIPNRPDAPGGGAERSPGRGATLGRYVLLERLGAGGMGVVHQVYDPELDRKIAVKLLRADAGVHSERTARLRREAQAMARLSHPNVITVHDVGVHEDQPFIAMELIDGQTLRHWLAEKSRPWREVVDVFVKAGRGLAAAHSAGVVHRDFKPDNVMIDRGGRVVVMDFGLARGDGDPTPAPPADRSPLGEDLTGSGVLLGTPAYMSPEQCRGDAADPLSDQFAFCISLYEALYSERPFEPAAGANLNTNDALSAAILEGKVRSEPAGSSVPAWLRKVVLRGLQVAPGERYPSMDALLDDLGSDPGAARRRWIAGAAVTLVALAGGVALYVAGRGAAASPPCRGAEARLAGVWDPAVRDRMLAAWRATGRAGAEDAFGRVAARLDAYAASWTAAHVDACEATQVRGEQSTDLMDLRMQCLDDRRRQLAALTQVFAEKADAELIDKGVEAVGRLDPVSRCADADALRAAYPPPADPGLATQVAQVEDEVARGKALARAARNTDALTALEAAAGKSASIAYPPLRGRSLAALGDLYETLDRKEAEATLHAAGKAAGEARDDALFAFTLTSLLRVLVEARRFDEAAAVAAVAEGVVARAGRDPETEAALLVERALLAEGRGELEPARDLLLHAVELREKARGPDDERVGATLTFLARIYYRLGKMDDALAAGQRARDVLERVYGPSHPTVAAASTLLGAVYGQLDRQTDAIREAERALAIYEATLGPEHLNVAKVLSNLGSMYQSLGRHEDAERVLARAIAIKVKQLGPDHPDVAMSLINQASSLTARDRNDEAITLLRRVLAIREKAFAPDAAEVGDAAWRLAEVLVDHGDPDEALKLIERALAIRAKLGRMDHPYLFFELSTQGRCYLKKGDPRHALPILEHALTVAVEKKLPDGYLTGARFALARALWDTGGDHKRARELAEKAHTDMARDPETPKGDLADIEAWLAKHR